MYGLFQVEATLVFLALAFVIVATKTRQVPRVQSVIRRFPGFPLFVGNLLNGVFQSFLESTRPVPGDRDSGSTDTAGPGTPESRSAENPGP